ncbi:MAG: deoxyribonuclease IV [Candidatus Schekmanbacteria bacterium RBG_16_38_10]|uniref:Probable endonuclease 4 n=1 Tax=Candidatus Schekmanbacteria bacterium RBG_16_38_10 TaxID=1817879 RepID=A0A1F7RYI3_9BACT|nr:MAG: deoxyribonuclease IV [Candidatus Schekmanbacteria bacterium RBG_16_38_10]
MNKPKNFKTPKLLLGAHMSIEKGVDRAIERGKSIGCTTIQIFTKSNTQWRAIPLKKSEIENFRIKKEESEISPVFGHSCYLINLASNDKEIYSKSKETLLTELSRCETLGIPFLVMHPGSHMGAGEKEGIKRIAESLDEIFDKIINYKYKVKIAIETTAGQGRNLGYRFEQMAEIIRLMKYKRKAGICLDTCHIFAAGYDIRDEKGYKKTIDDFDKIIGIKRLMAIHLNDSKKELGSRVDRHWHIGKGFIGLDAFRFIMNDKRFIKIPKVLETPKEADMKEDVMNLKVLKSLL